LSHFSSSGHGISSKNLGQTTPNGIKTIHKNNVGRKMEKDKGKINENDYRGLENLMKNVA